MMKIDELKELLLDELARCKGRASLFMEINGEIIEFNSNHVYQSASLIKLPILYAALRLVDKGVLSLKKLVPIRETDEVGDTGVLQVLMVDQLSVQDLLALMIIVSDNTATNLVIDEIGMGEINSKIALLGMDQTVLKRKMLDFNAIKNGNDNFTTARDTVACLKEGTAGSTLTNHSKGIFQTLLKQQQLKDKLRACLDEPRIEAGNKTGELPGVEHDCGFIFDEKTQIHVAILIDQLNDPEAGRTTIRQIGKHINDFICRDMTRTKQI
ncbi:serine hydrolase [Mesobacillus subterraneus]|nr:serine hydrolase [Mesobacillus subterraneus]